ncbi:MAG: Na+/H+ antiporter subunit E [Desulfococcaceae bacterium]
MNGFLLNILLALAWVALTEKLDSPNFLFGFVLGYAALWFAGRVFGFSYSAKAWQAICFIGYFLKEMTLSNLRVAYEVLTPTHHMQPAIVKVPLDLDSDAAITLLANFITLTPGTLSLSVSRDRKALFVHTMHLDNRDPEAFRRKIKEELETRVRDLFS